MVKDLIPENPYDEKILSVWETVNSWGWGKFIPLDECFEKFNVPEGSKLEDRIRNNFIYYRTNYLALYGLLLLITSCLFFASFCGCRYSRSRSLAVNVGN
ncbi:hypothetical protein JH06_2366 [Blastocystis sp. subtype 4]|uniref:hypothetical protein n=1 Tax=Blastocystis sp. subtype 4 TaxID=944170 RepID=UPI0007118E8E|nr:hypothetical protein JH06_2366 [Blastocystis sp. subtype 4]KNB44739.1 hypothetical protein JH06_2366 [Blastocystis sp. subtype 4]|eukprot:XP_014528182.1 hypothetical protein JH06_2366 [Blastocystis sp. subtype 4]